MSGSLKKWYATAMRGLTMLMTLPNASGAVWIWVPTSRAVDTEKPNFAIMSGTVMKHS